MKTQTAKRHKPRKDKRKTENEERLIAENGRSTKAPRLTISHDGPHKKIDLDHPDKVVGGRLLAKALGASDMDFLFGILSQLNDASANGYNDEQAINFLLSVIKDIAPRDQVEAMLAAQMAVVHVAAMTFAARLAHVEEIAQQDSAERAFNKLTRTFATQLEALKRYRTGGEQKVTVQHVTVGEGGQAIVGNVTQRQREEPTDKPATSPPALNDARNSAMPILEEKKTVVPVAARRRRQK